MILHNSANSDTMLYRGLRITNKVFMLLLRVENGLSETNNFTLIADTWLILINHRSW